MVGIPASACDECGNAFHQPATGRRRHYCGRNCRQLAYMRRRILKELGLDQNVSDETGRGALDVPSAPKDEG